MAALYDDDDDDLWVCESYVDLFPPKHLWLIRYQFLWVYFLYLCLFMCKQFGIHDNETGTKLAAHNVTTRNCALSK